MGLREWLAAGRAIAGGDLLRASAKAQRTTRFEAELAGMTGVHHALAMNSGTSALVAGLAALGVGPGDEVLVPAYTWMATAAAPVSVGAVPVLVDVDATLTMDPEDMESKITPATRAVMPVHMLNLPADMDRILAIARANGLYVLEDAAQAVGVTYKGRYCGAMGDAGVFSFNQHKNMSIGEGGALLTNEPRIFARAWNAHDLGMGYRGQAFEAADAPFVGANYRATEVSGAMLSVQLARLRGRLKAMAGHAAAMREILEAGGVPLAPHNDPKSAVSLVATFPTEEAAKTFAENRGVLRLFDNSKHVYTHWDAILAKRTHHPRFDPWAWAARPIDYGPKSCPRTLDLLRRSCRINLGERYPRRIMTRRARALVQKR